MAIGRHIRLGERGIDLESGSVLAGGRLMQLTPVEVRLLRYLAMRAGEVVSRDDVWREVWRGDERSLSRAIDSTVVRLRRKLEPDPRQPRYLRSIYGSGFVLENCEVAPTAGRGADPPPERVVGTRRAVEPSPLIGRDALCEQVALRVQGGARILALVGPPGVGKSAVAEAVALAVAGAYPGGTWTCELAGAVAEHDVMTRLATTFAAAGGARKDEGDAASWLAEVMSARGATLLLAHDAEQLAASGRNAIRELVARAPSLRVIVTTRRGWPGESAEVIEVPPLDETDAVALFRRRAGLPLDRITPSDLEATTALARRLDHLPLAIVLAASRAAVLSPAEITARLDRSPDLLNDPLIPGAHGSLARALAVSWDLLEPTAQRVLACCSLFGGSFNLDAVEASLDDKSGSVLDALQVLLAHHMIVACGVTQPNASRRFLLLRTIRDFSAQRLAVSGERPLARARLAACFGELALAAFVRISESADRDDLHQLAVEADNLRAVAAADPTRHAVHCRLALAALHNARGPHMLAREHAEGAEDLARSIGDRALVADTLLMRSVVSYLYQPTATALPTAVAAVEAARDAREPGLLARTLLHLGITLASGGEHARAAAAFEEAHELYRAQKSRPGLARSESLVAWSLATLERSEAAYERNRSALDRYRSIGPCRGHAIALVNQGAVALDLALPEARSILERALAMNAELGHTLGEATAHRLLAVTALLAADLARARAHVQAAIDKEAAVDDERNLAYSHVVRGVLGLYEGDLARASLDLGGASAVGEQHHDDLLCVRASAFAAVVCLRSGDTSFAKDYLDRAQRRAEGQASHGRIALLLDVVRRAFRGDSDTIDQADVGWDVRLALRGLRDLHAGTAARAVQSAHKASHHRGVHIDGPRMRARREQRCLSAGELADLAGTTKKSVHRAERGGPVSAAVARELSRVLEIPLVSIARLGPAETSRRLFLRGLSAPVVPPGWIERAEEVARIQALLTRSSDRRCVVALAGPVGIGKTAIAQYVAAACADAFPDGVVWIDGRSIVDAPNVQAVRRALCDALLLDPLLPARDADGVHERAFRHHLWERRVLLVLDDLLPESQVGTFIEAGIRCHVLVTTHVRHVADAIADDVIVIGPMSGAVSREVLGRPIDARRLAVDPAGTDELLMLAAGVPRTLQLIGRGLAREALTTPSHYARRIHQITESTANDFDPSAFAGSTLEAMAARFGPLLVLCRHLSPEAWSVLPILGLFDERPLPAWLVAAVADVDGQAALRGLGELVDLYFVRLTEDHALAPSEDRWLLADTHTRTLARALLGDRYDQRMERLIDAVLGALSHESRQPWRHSLAWYRRHGEILHRIFEHLSRDLPRDLSLAAMKGPADVPSVSVEPASARRLCELVVHLDLMVTTHPVVDSGVWLVRALVAAKNQPDPILYGRVLHQVGWCQASTTVDWLGGRVWFDAAQDLLLAAGDLLGAAAAHSLRMASWSEEDQRHHHAALALVRRSAAQGLELAQWLLRLGTMPAMVEAPSRRAADAELFDEARAAAERAGAAGAWIAALARASAATHRRIAGDGSHDEELEAALLDVIDRMPSGNDLVVAAILAQGAHFGLAMRQGNVARAREHAIAMWRRAIRLCDHDDIPHTAFILAQAVFFQMFAELLPVQPRHEQTCAMTLDGVVAGPRLPGLAGYSTSLLFSSDALRELLDLPCLDLIEALVGASYSTGDSARRNLQVLRRIRQGLPPFG